MRSIAVAKHGLTGIVDMLGCCSMMSADLLIDTLYHTIVN